MVDLIYFLKTVQALNLELPESVARDFCPRARAVANEVHRLQAIVDKLPKTADGVPVVPGDIAYTTDGRSMRINTSASGHVISDCYSTREAAEAAKETT